MGLKDAGSSSGLETPSNRTGSRSQPVPSAGATTKEGKDSSFKKRQSRTEHTPPPQSMPREWKWKCHLCRSKYRLGVTNRCLKDGHYFCFGKSTNGANGKVIRGRACISYVDSNGWRKRNGYRRVVRCLRGIESSPGCWEDCNYPGMCHEIDSDTDSSASVDTRQGQHLKGKQKDVLEEQGKRESINPAVIIQTAKKELWNPTIRSTADKGNGRDRRRTTVKREFLQVLDKTASGI